MQWLHACYLLIVSFIGNKLEGCICNPSCHIEIVKLYSYISGSKFLRTQSKVGFFFCNFCEKFENSKWLPFWARQKFFENWDGYSAEIPCGSKILSKSLYLAWFSRYKHFCVFLIWKICND